MSTTKPPKITVSTNINLPVTLVWDYWTKPEHIVHWNNASDDWHTPRAENDLRPGGSFLSRMESKDGSMGFDFSGVYSAVQTHILIAYSLEDGREIEVLFESADGKTKVTEKFDPENENPADMQQAGWQAILNNFRKYAESR